MEKVEFLPIGSIVIVRGGIKKTMVISRGLAVNLDSGRKYFDYGGCLYPEGLMGDKIVYFNHADIVKVVFEGFTDDDNTLMTDNINFWLEKTDIVRGDPYELNQQNQQNQQK